MGKAAAEREISVDGRRVGPSAQPFVIAEMSGNHNGSLERALKIVDAAVEAGAQALKIQTYTADTMTLDIAEREFRIDDPKSLWHGETLYELYRRASTPWEWHKPIFDRCRKRGIIGFSTPFDATAVELLESLEVPLYKVASLENVDLPLIRRIAKTGKPMIISTGLATAAELRETVAAARGAGCKDLVLLKCTSAYPADPAESNLATIPDLRKRFDVQVGVSDHTLGIGSAVAAVVLGATVIEKHFTLRRADGGVDSAFSLEPEELGALVRESRDAWRSVGKVAYGPTKGEETSLLHRRSLYIVKDMKAGEALTPENLRAIRPGRGLAPKHYERFLGRKVRRDVARGTPLGRDLV